MVVTLVGKKFLMQCPQLIINASSKLLKYGFTCIILFLFMLLFIPAHAQVWINGYLKDKFSKSPVANGEVRSSLSSALSDSNGFFRIRITEGDIISVKRAGYRFDTIHFSFAGIDSSLVIYMDPLGSAQ